MDEHKKTYTHHEDIVSDWHEYTDGVHTGTGFTQDLADKAYQDAKKDDKESVHYVVDPKDDGPLLTWNDYGEKVDRSKDSDDNSDSNESSNSSGCFITTACIESKGLADDCYELNVLRQFRDNYMRHLPSGNMEIKRYYEIAPKIVSKINERVDKKEIWQSVYYRLMASIKLVEEKDSMSAYLSYKNLIKDLSDFL